ncbi:MAG TPA: molybdopterin-binding protein [Xanthobacteraceae bacterium]|nr:molybdopterin-binding protein [Xanthobacteraceae bacterium]
MASSDKPQRIARLTPLADALAALARVARPVASRGVELDLALGRVIAADAAIPQNRHARAVALRDGWAVKAELVADAGVYAPVPVAAAWVETGEVLPDDADAVLPPDAVTEAGGAQEATVSAAPGEGVLRAVAGGAAEPIRRAGFALRNVDLAALRAAGVRRVGVREPLVRIVSTNRQLGPTADTAAPLIAALVESAGGRVHITRASVTAGALENGLRDGNADAVITIGGTGEGRGDRAVAVAAAHGRVSVHGIGIRPGETAALAEVGDRPVLMLPGRLDAAFAAWLLLGRPLLAHLTGAQAQDAPIAVPLRRKITSTIGLAEIVLVRLGESGAEPLPVGIAPAEALARADAWVLVPAESEGYPAGASVEARPLP